ncbi:CHAT domain-containing protein [Streptomyces viridochromogenes]|uniref:CHAT domain-containing protein n=1 Tax=Streptomyces viridochromogenes TaxID=1938 RepID=UPI00131AE3E6|nr:CHAT domain-containing protein [Streptomyces viridochromogenes]
MAGTSVAGIGFALSAIGVLALLLVGDSSRFAEVTGRQAVDTLTDHLDRSVRLRCESEVREAGLEESGLLPVDWVVTARPDGCSPRQPEGDAVLFRTSRHEEMAAAFRALPAQRLIVTGPPGAGKSTLVVLLTLELLRSRTGDDPVPVLMQLTSYDPREAGLTEWLQRQIAGICDGLSDTPADRARAADLIADGRMLPVLDGLDDLPVQVREAFLDALMRDYPAAAPLVLTCRSMPFSWIAHMSGTVTVVEPGPIDPGDALGHLSHGTAPPRDRWFHLADFLARYPDSALARVLARPLGVVLVRSAYAGGDADLRDLVDMSRFRTPADIGEHLLDRVMSASLQRERQPRRGHGWDPVKARRYLSFLARSVARGETSVLAWWKLHLDVAGLTRTWSRVLIWTLAAALLHLPLAALVAHDPGLPTSLAAAGETIAGAMATATLIAVRDRLSGRMRWRRRPVRLMVLTSLCGGAVAAAVLPLLFMATGRTSPEDLGYGATTGLLIAGTVALAAHLTAGRPTPPGVPDAARGARTGPSRAVEATVHVSTQAILLAVLWFAALRTPLVLGICLLLVVPLLRDLRRVAAVHDVTSPRSSLNAARRVTVVKTTGLALLGALSWPLLDSAAIPWAPAPADVLAVAWTFGAAVVLSGSTWANYTVARLYLALRGQVPLRLQLFLTHACHLGVLSRSGPFYRFRHLALQNHLAEVRATAWEHAYPRGAATTGNDRRARPVPSLGHATPTDNIRSSPATSRTGDHSDHTDHSDFNGGTSQGPLNGKEVDHPEQRRLRAELAEQASPGREVPLHVQVTRGGGQEGVVLRPFELPAEGARLLITVHAPGLLALGDLQQELWVEPGRDSDVLRFGLRTDRPGAHTVTVRAFRGGSFLGELRLEISVQADVPARDGAPRTAPLDSLAFDPGEVTLQVLKAADGYTFQLLSETSYAPAFQLKAGDPRQATENIYRELRRIAAAAGAGTDARQVRRRLQNLGVALWRAAVPDAVRGQFWRETDKIRAFTVLGEHDVVPWELLYPLDGTQQGDGFLAEWLPVVRRVFGQERVRQLLLPQATFVVPPGSPPEADLEVTALRARFGPVMGDGGVLTRGAEIQSRLDEGLGGLLHFACHNAFTEAGSQVTMADGPFDPIDLATAQGSRALGDTRPLVFFNACRSAGQIDWYAASLGWAPQFLEAGAGAFIGTLWPVRSDSALAYADAFYTHLVTDGLPLGEASMKARQAIRNHGGDPTWLAYALYGSPAARAALATPGSADDSNSARR